MNNFTALQTTYSKTFNNGCELLNDAQLLFENERYPRAYLLAHISIEEFGRCIMLASAMMKFKIRSLDVKKLIKRQTNHHSKIELAYSFVKKLKEYSSPLSTEDRLEITMSLFLKPGIIDQEEIQMLDDLKNSSFYVDQYENVTKEPNEIITFEEANVLLTLANLLKEYIEYNKWHEDDKLIKLCKSMKKEPFEEIKIALYRDVKKI